jgi:hypothetical protein
MGTGNVPPEVEEDEKHLRAIQSLSEQHHLPPATVAEIYERELAAIKHDALITTYLPIFVTRRVGDLLKSLATAATARRAGRSGSLSR